MRTTSSIVMTVCHKSLYRATPSALHEIMEDLFTHSLASAIFARDLAVLVKYRAPEEAFLAALLHDVASPLILRMLSEILHANRTIAVGELEFVALVNELHTEIGVTLLKKWELTGELLYAVENHESLTHGHAYSLINNITFLANVLAKSCGFALVEEPDMEAQEVEGIKALGITPQQLGALKVSVIDRAEREIAILSGT
jgi:HD-like signal output (HDOD) protein